MRQACLKAVPSLGTKRRIHIDYRMEELLKRNGLEAYLNAVKGVR